MDISKETRKSFKFYASLLLGFAMLMTGCIIEPQGQIHSSVLMAGGMILTISAGCIGIDLAEIIHQFVLLRSNRIEDVKEDIKENKD